MFKQVKSLLLYFVFGAFFVAIGIGLSACGTGIHDGEVATLGTGINDGDGTPLDQEQTPRMSDGAKNAVLNVLAEAAENSQENSALEVSGSEGLSDIGELVGDIYQSILEVVFTTIDEICEELGEAEGAELEDIENICEITIDGEIFLLPLSIVQGFLEVFDPENGPFLCELDGQNLDELLLDPGILDEICSLLPECLVDEDCSQGSVCEEGFCIVEE